MNEEYKHSIDDISKLTGVKPKTLKESWERFCNLPEPKRDPKGRRWYSDNDIPVYKRIAELKDQHSLPEIGELIRQEFPDYFQGMDSPGSDLASQPNALVIKTNDDLIKTVQDIADTFTDRNQELLSELKQELSGELNRNLRTNFTDLSDSFKETISKNWNSFHELNQRFNEISAEKIILESKNRELTGKVSDLTWNLQELTRELEKVRAENQEKEKKLRELEDHLKEYKNLPWYKKIFKSI